MRLEEAEELYASLRTNPAATLQETLAGELVTALATAEAQELEIESLQKQVDKLKDNNLELTLAELQQATTALNRAKETLRGLAQSLPEAKTKELRQRLVNQIQSQLRSL